MKPYMLCSTRNNRTDKHLPKPLYNHPLRIILLGLNRYAVGIRTTFSS
jgi:hypothetical protein